MAEYGQENFSVSRGGIVVFGLLVSYDNAGPYTIYESLFAISSQIYVLPFWTSTIALKISSLEEILVR